MYERSLPVGTGALGAGVTGAGWGVCTGVEAVSGDIWFLLPLGGDLVVMLRFIIARTPGADKRRARPCKKQR